MRAAVIANPVAGRGVVWRRLRRELAAAGHELQVFETRGAGDASRIALELAAAPPERVVVCGGDGTINEVVSALPDPPFAVGIIPAGTSNVLARELGVPRDPRAALDAALSGEVRRVDLGVVDCPGRRYFLLMAGFGLDAFVVARVRWALKRHLGVAAYAAATLQCLASYTFPEFVVTTERESFRASSCIVANARGYGGGFVLNPQAEMTDGWLDVLAIEPRTRLAYARLLVASLRGAELAKWARRTRARQVELDGPRSVRAQVDGELAGSLPARVTLVPRAFPLVFPPSP